MYATVILFDNAHPHKFSILILMKLCPMSHSMVPETVAMGYGPTPMHRDSMLFATLLLLLLGREREGERHEKPLNLSGSRQLW